MRRICCVTLLLGTVAVSLLLGCGQQSTGNNSNGQPPVVAKPADPTNPQLVRADPDHQKPPRLLADGQLGELTATGIGLLEKDFAVSNAGYLKLLNSIEEPIVDDNQDKYDAAVLEAIELLSQKKYVEALASMEAAYKFKETELVLTEMKKLRLRIEQQDAAERTLEDIQTLFEQGKVTEAGLLATAALSEYGSTDVAPEFVKLKLQTDALAASELNDNAAKFKALRDQGQIALGMGNLRAAALALEQALQFGEDAQVRKTSDDLRVKLGKYDDNRQKADELRKNPTTLGDALDLLKDAAKEWDTPEIRQQIDEYSLALQNRRDRIAIADFEVRGEVGIPLAERAIPEELLPHFKGKYDLVERSQIAKVLDELKLEAGNLAMSDQDQKEVGRLSKVRYLVMGSVSRFGGLSVNARLVDVQTGLIVQTAKITAGSPEELLTHLPELAKLLLMTDQEQMAAEKEAANQAPVVQPVDPEQALPPPPEAPVAEQPLPPPQIVDTLRPPDQGPVQLDDFKQFQPVPEGQPLPPIQYGGVKEELWKKKALQVSVYLGDNFFRRGRHHEAMRRFEFGLTLAPGAFDIDIRITRVRPFLPPPPVIIVVPPPPRPRLAIIDFAIVGNPAVVPPSLSWWTPKALAPYFSPPYEIADPGEVYWWMGRMGMTVHDLMVDPYARRWLGRALNIRYFVFGTVTQTFSFNVDTYMIDAEHGYLNGRGLIHAHNQNELRFRIGELARMTQTPPNLWQQQKQEIGVYDGLVVKGRAATDKGEITIAIGFFQDALKLRPKSAEVLVYMDRLDRLARQRALEEQRRKDFELQQKLSLARKLRLDELAHEAERQRILAAQAAAALNQQQQLALQKQRLAAELTAYNQMVIQARVAAKGNNFTLSIQVYESALRLRQNDDVFRELATVRAQLDSSNKLRQIQEQQLREAKLRLQKEEELARTRALLEKERVKRQLEEAALRKTQEARDNAEYFRLVDIGEKQMVNSQFNAAISTFQAARRLKKTDQIESLVNQAMLAQTRAVADAKGAAARKDLENKLAVEKLARAKAEAEAAANQAKYLVLLKNAQKAQAAKDYDLAIANYTDAGKIFKTDVVLTGLSQAQTARTKTLADAAAAKTKQLAEQNKQANFQAFMKDGQAAMTGKDYAKAVEKFNAARALIPNNVDAVAALNKAQQFRDQAAIDARKKSQDDERMKTFNRLLKDGQDNLARKQLDAAVANLTEALKLSPGDPTAAKALKTAQAAQTANVKNAQEAAAAKKTADAYQKAMADGRLALQNKQFDSAIQAFGQAQKLFPGDAASQNFLKDAQKKKDDLRTAELASAKKRQEDLQRQYDLQKALGEARTALVAKNFAGAEKSLAVAVKLAPQDPAVAQFQKDLQAAKTAANAADAAQQKRKTQFDTLFAAGKKALDEKRYDAAIKAFSDANGFMPGDKTNLDMLHLAQQGQQVAKAGDQAKKTAYDQAIKQGQGFLTAKKFDEAVKQFQLAGVHMPGDPTAAALLKQAEQGRVQGEQQRIADFNRLMAEGNAALGAKKFQEAVNSFTAAAKLMPTDKNAVNSLRNANELWNVSKAPGGPTPAQLTEFNKQMQLGAAFDKQKKFDDAVKAYDLALKQIPKDATAQGARNKAVFHLHMIEGNRVMAAKNFPAAVVQFEAALRLFPNDPDASAALKQAQQGGVQGDQQRIADFNRLMAEGNAALGAKKFQEAVNSFTAAAKLMPSDKNAQNSLRNANELWNASKAPAGPTPAQLAEFNKQMQLGAGFDKQKKFDDAVKAYDLALKQIPKDAKAQAGRNKAVYHLHMIEGNRVMAAKNFPAAVVQFEAALRLFPNDPDATAALKKAKAGK